MSDVTSITLYKTDEGFELSYERKGEIRKSGREKVPHLRGVVQAIRKAGLEMVPTPSSNILGPPMPQGKIDELMEAQKRSDAATVGELAPHTADLGEHVEALREARPEFLKRPLPERCLMLNPVPRTFPLLVRANPGSIILDEHEERELNRVAALPAGPGHWMGEPMHLHLDRSKPVEIERDGLTFIKHSADLRSLFR